MPKVPQWGVWLMFLASCVGVYLLGAQLAASHWRP